MNILEITRSFYPSLGGLEKFVADRINVYNNLNFDYSILSTDFATEKIVKISYPYKVNYIQQFTPYNITPSINKFLNNTFDLLSVNQVGRFFSDYSIWWAHQNKVKTIVTPHFYFHSGRFNLLKKIHKKFILKKILKLADAIICFTNVEKQFILRIDPELDSKIHLIPHYFSQIEIEKKEISDGSYILYLGRYDKNKRIDLLLKAFNQLEENSLKLYLTINQCDLPKHLHQYVDKRTYFIGNISESEKINYLKGCSAVILPSDHEAFGIVLLEASNFYKPILASDLSVLHEVLNSDGVIFFENSDNSISSALRKFQTLTVSEKKVMGAINYQNLRNYRFENIVQLYKKLYSNLFTR